MKKILTNLILFVVLSLTTLIAILSTIGIETNKFNNLIREKTSKEKNINLKLETIKFKINPKELSLFLETQNPEIMYKDLLVPVSNIKVYVDFLSLLKSDLIINFLQLYLIIFDILSFLKPLPFEKREMASNRLVFPEPLLPKKTLQFSENFNFKCSKFLKFTKLIFLK